MIQELLIPWVRLVCRSVANCRLTAFPFPQFASSLRAYVLQMSAISSNSDQTSRSTSEYSAAATSNAWNSLRSRSTEQGSQGEIDLVSQDLPDARTLRSVTIPVAPMGDNRGQDATVEVRTGQEKGKWSHAKPPMGPNAQNAAAQTLKYGTTKPH